MNRQRAMLAAVACACLLIGTAQGQVLRPQPGPVHIDPPDQLQIPAAPASQPAGDIKAKIQAAIGKSQLVFTATVANKITNWPSPPDEDMRHDSVVTLKDPSPIKGETPDKLNCPLTFGISVRPYQPFDPAIGKKVLVIGNVALARPIIGGPPTLPGQGRAVEVKLNVSLLVEATDANVAVAKETAGPNTPEGKLDAAVRPGELVFTATVDKLVMFGAAQPPTQQVTVKDVVMLKGDKPAHLDCRYPRTMDLPFNPDLKQKVLIAAHPEPKEAPLPPNSVSGRHTGPLPMLGGNGPEIFFMAEATDANVTLAREALKPAAPASAPESAGPATDSAEVKLFADEDWYKNLPAKEKGLMGKLEAVPQADGVTTLMRTSYYRLGSRMVYTMGKKVAALDALVGKNVVLRGKQYDADLEGQAVHEIWPAGVTLVGPPAPRELK